MPAYCRSAMLLPTRTGMLAAAWKRGSGDTSCLSIDSRKSPVAAYSGRADRVGSRTKRSRQQVYLSDWFIATPIESANCLNYSDIWRFRTIACCAVGYRSFVPFCVIFPVLRPTARYSPDATKNNAVRRIIKIWRISNQRCLQTRHFRWPASNADPYRVTSRIMKTYAEAHEKAVI
jgi:hypothetical protein